MNKNDKNCITNYNNDNEINLNKNQIYVTMNLRNGEEFLRTHIYEFR